MERATSKDGTTIAFDRSGQGPAIVLVGGALSDRSAAFPIAARLAPRFTAIAYDRRGRGDSGTRRRTGSTARSRTSRP